MDKKEKINKVLIYSLAIIIPIVIIGLYAFFRNIIEEGTFFYRGETYLVGDMHQQYTSVYAYIWDIFHGNQSIFYSFSKDLGGEMLTTLFYYGTSPFNLIYPIFSKQDIPLITFFIYCIKISLCSLFSLIFFNYKFGFKKSNLIFALLYGFSGYCVAFYFHSMWLDVVYMSPLVLMGIEKLIKGKPLMYVITLTLSIFFNFYIAYMLCLFCIIYFFYELFLIYKVKEFKKYKKILYKFILYSILAVLMNAVIIFSVIYGLSNVLRTEHVNATKFIEYRNLFDAFIYNFLKQFEFGMYGADAILGFKPRLYIGLITLVLNITYFFNKRINKREKILSFIVYLIFAISLVFTIPFKIWHGFIFPSGYAGRYTFLFTLFMLITAIKNYRKLEYIKIEYLILFIFIFSIFNFYLIRKEMYGDNTAIYLINILLIIIYCIIIFTYKKIFKNKLSVDLKYLLVFIAFVELVFNYNLGLITAKESYIAGNFYDYSKNVCPIYSNKLNEFYRVGRKGFYGFLDPIMCNYYGTSSIITTNNKSYINFWKKYGGTSVLLGTYYNPNRLPILDSVLGIKYIEDNVLDSNSYYKLVDNKKYTSFNIDSRENITDMYIYENPYALSIGYLIPNNYTKYENLEGKTNFDNLNILMKELTGNDQDVIIYYPRENFGNDRYIFNINNDAKEIYFTSYYGLVQLIDGNINSNVITINDEYNIFSSTSDKGIYKIKNEFKNSKIDVRIANRLFSNSKKGSLYAAWLDTNTFKKDVEILRKNQLKNVLVDKNKIFGEINVKEESTLFMSIPYDKNWNVYVDGEKVTYDKVLNEFIGIKLNKGYHKIELKYVSKEFFYGMVISLISLFVTIVLVIMEGKKYEEQKS